MSDKFVPFAPGISATGSSTIPMQVRVLTQPAAASLQTPSAPRSRATDSLVAPPAQPASSCSKLPVIKLEREGDRVTQIRIECGCGQVIELGCVY